MKARFKLSLRGNKAARWILGLFAASCLFSSQGQAQVVQADDYYPVVFAKNPDGSDTTCHLHYQQFYSMDQKPASGFHKMIFIHGGAWMSGPISRLDDVLWIPPIPQNTTWTDPQTNETMTTHVAYSGDPNNAFGGFTWGTGSGHDESGPIWSPSVGLPVLAFVQNGYLVTVIDYRSLLFIGDTKNPIALSPNACEGKLATTDDMKRDLLMAYGLTVNNSLTPPSLSQHVNQSEKILIYGESAGAHLAMLLASMLDSTTRMNQIAVVANSGPLDFDELWRMSHDSSFADSPTLQRYPLNSWAYSATHDNILNDGSVKVTDNAYLYAFQDLLVNFPSRGDVLAESTFRVSMQNASPPVYLVAGVHDVFTFVLEQSMKYCESLGSVSFIESTAEHSFYQCGSNSKYDLITDPAQNRDAGYDFVKNCLGGDPECLQHRDLSQTPWYAWTYSGHVPTYWSLLIRIDSWFADIR